MPAREFLSRLERALVERVSQTAANSTPGRRERTLTCHSPTTPVPTTAQRRGFTEDFGLSWVGMRTPMGSGVGAYDKDAKGTRMGATGKSLRMIRQCALAHAMT